MATLLRRKGRHASSAASPGVVGSLEPREMPPHLAFIEGLRAIPARQVVIRQVRAMADVRAGG
jgi:hypothetical protein